ncbi:hypothetical protein ACF0H5_003745 [Mactra antiquata]
MKSQNENCLFVCLGFTAYQHQRSYHAEERYRAVIEMLQRISTIYILYRMININGTPTYILSMVHQHIYYLWYTDIYISPMVHRHIYYQWYTDIYIINGTPTYILSMVHRHIYYQWYTDIYIINGTPTYISSMVR